MKWFKLMWENGYIQVAVIELFFLITGLCLLTGWKLLVCIIPIAGLTAISYLGFYKHWIENKDD